MCRLLMRALLRCARWGLCLPLLLLLAPVTSWASETPATYQITAAELQRLDDNLTRLKQINEELRQASGQQKNQIVDLQTALTQAQQQLTEARRQQTVLQLQIQTLITNSKKQETSLQAANESFVKFGEEQKRTRVRIKAQRNTWVAAAGILAAGLALK